jgi:hypothetical protein
MSEVTLFPYIGGLPVDSISPPLVLDSLRPAERQGKRETAHSLRQYAGQTFR